MALIKQSYLQVEHLQMTKVQAEVYTEALDSLRSAARESGLQPGAPRQAFAASYTEPPM